MPRDLETIVLKAIAKGPADRFADAGAMAAELGRFLEGRPIRSRPLSLAERLWRWSRRNPARGGVEPGGGGAGGPPGDRVGGGGLDLPRAAGRGDDGSGYGGQPRFWPWRHSGTWRPAAIGPWRHSGRARPSWAARSCSRRGPSGSRAESGRRAAAARP